ncbi:hypothetical protein Pla22_33740 [Rubripirellula amarantea]|uniref:PEP-CTERM protein-sorting domain-containing protein n=1 Tax=Rubripirellula amarantea TaxID=2527999 RepID=A0A5C5WKR7_9BACT|nr:hypothetical protein [Rubripirellula amarantea]TWT50631.1 hypothetical protein Pla22_33740 [Rubripirellula amarantea]
MKRLSIFVALAIVSLLADARTASADLVVSFTEMGGSVVTSISGSIDLTGLSNVGDVPESISVRPSNGTFYVGSTSGIPHEHYFVPSSVVRTGPLSFGSGGYTAATSGSGDFIGFTANSGNFNIYLPENYVSNTLVTGTANYAGESFASLGIDPGVYTWNAGANQITATIAAVPKPSSVAFLMIAGLGAGVVRFRHRRRTA